jgi:hypothetical protein
LSGPAVRYNRRDKRRISQRIQKRPISRLAPDILPGLFPIPSIRSG